MLVDKVISILKKDGIGIIPTDTLYGIVGSAFSKKVVERIYEVKGRDENKPFIILISKISDLKKFSIVHTNILQNVGMYWPGKVTVVLPLSKSVWKKFEYLHRGTRSLAFRLPKKKALIELLNKTGPLVAPSANPQGLEPAHTITEAKHYFRDGVDFYVSGGRLESAPSTIVSLSQNNPKILRQGSVVIRNIE